MSTAGDVVYVNRYPNGSVHLRFYCPACRFEHVACVQAPTDPRASKPKHVWKWNGSTTKPTLDPSLVFFYPTPHKKPDGSDYRCHFVMTDGVIAYQADCLHSMAGQSVPMRPDQPTSTL